MAAWVLIQSGHPEKAQSAVIDLLQKHTPATLFILNVLDWSHVDIRPFVPALTSLTPDGDYIVGEEQRMVTYLLQSHGLPVPPRTVSASDKQTQLNVIKDM